MAPAPAVLQKQQDKSVPQGSAEHHMKAAECCSHAAAEHTQAAKACTAGDKMKAAQHAEQAACHCAEAQDHSDKAKVAT